MFAFPYNFSIFISLNWGKSLHLFKRLPNCHYVLQNMQAIWEMQETLNGEKWNSSTFCNLWTNFRHCSHLKTEFLLRITVLHYSQSMESLTFKGLCIYSFKWTIEVQCLYYHSQPQSISFVSCKMFLLIKLDMMDSNQCAVFRSYLHTLYFSLFCNPSFVHSGLVAYQSSLALRWLTYI
jgi:hypothetical protein